MYIVILCICYQNLVEDWVIGSECYGWFEMYIVYEGDLWDWIVVDELLDDVLLLMWMLLGFLVVYYSMLKLQFYFVVNGFYVQVVVDSVKCYFLFEFVEDYDLL